ncbi:HotDog domain-containing protein [Gilbertella persicaria]|uniref:HotDog domain-containing protein n=1 Tax=Gilbertella persicaria TaxID=101096 RepID=UPI00221F9B5F|nr:HotDog domain-containing protein [Gilbertella persicaria]KAI8082598.1 HotDog domain-containing protein [Gilbertella persicaria]
MPNSTFPAVISFADKKNSTPVITAKFGDENDEDFGIRMANAVEVEEIDVNLYMSKELWLPAGARGAFGGQIVAQALRAAFYTVEEEFDVHSLHSYFILPGNVEMPVIYQVQRLRDGRSYATRFVTASQGGKAIFVCSFGFAKPDKNIQVTHQTQMPKVPEPETLPSEVELLQKALENKDLPPKYHEHIKLRIEESSPVDYREINVPSPSFQAQRWFKTRGHLASDKRLHACVIAYASDSGFIGVTAKANDIPATKIGMLISLDHAVWFHAPARADEWLLYDMHSPRTNDGRGIVFGRIYNKDGKLIATTAQEGVVRLTKKEIENRTKQMIPKESKL